ncbi:MAG: hypothetical protein ACOC2H_02850 [Spirochaetota bacterium]
MAEKNIIALNIKAVLPSFNEIVLMSGFIDTSVSEMLLHYSTVILGYEHEHFTVDVSSTQFVNHIFSAKNEYSIDTRRSEILSEQISGEFKVKLVESIIRKLDANDTGTVDYYIKRFLDHVFQTDDAKIYLAFQRISHGVLEVINAIERKQTHTVAQNSEIAQKYVGNNRELVSRVIESGMEDTIVCVYTVERGGKSIAAGAIFYNTLLESVISRYTVFSQQLDPHRFSPSNYIVDLFHEIKAFASSDSNMRDVVQKIETSLDSIHSERLGLILGTLDSAKIASLLTRALPAEYATASITVLCDRYNSIIVDTVFSPEVAITESDAETDEEDVPEKKAAVIDVDLVLGPAKGVKISSLKPGNRIYVIINAQSAMGRQVVNKLNLMEDNRVKPLSGVVESVRRDSKDNYIVLTKIANNLYGKSVEEEDVKVKSGDPVVDVKASRSNRSLLVGLVIGAFIIIIAVISFFVLI